MNTKYILEDVFLASPYSMDTNLNRELSEELFYRDYFIESVTYPQLNKQLNHVFKNTSHFLSTSIFLYGYSGTGKTTYIRWYANNYLNDYNKVFFDLADVVCENKSSNTGDNSQKDGCVKLFDIFFQQKVCDLFQKYPDDFNDLLSMLFDLRLNIATYFSLDFINKLEAYCENYSNNDMINPTFFINFARQCPYNDLLMILLLFYCHYPNQFGQCFEIAINKDLPLMIIFDNIDHIEIEYYNSAFPKSIESIYHNVKTIIRNQDNVKVNHTIHFVFCLRDANCSIINRQMSENTSRWEIEFLPLEDEADIFLKRISIAKQRGINLDLDNYDFFEYVLTDEYTKKSFLPLFNYNLRKFALFLCSLIRESESTYLKNIKVLSKITSTKNGSRGIEYYLIIKHLFKNDFLKQRLYLNDVSVSINKENLCYVNPARILLTNVLNKSKYSLDPHTRHPSSNPVGFYDLFDSFNEIYKGNVDLFLKILTNLFLFHQENWCHLITFDNKQVFSKDSFDNEKSILETLVNKLEDDNLDKKQELNNIKIRLNPAGFSYVRDITRHYEFFSIRAGNSKPLFCSLNDKYKMYDNDEFDFIVNIKKTFLLSKDCIENLIKFLESDTIKDYSNSTHCFKIYSNYDEFEDDPYNRTRIELQAMRIIDTHIRYIDTFRIYILNNDRYLNKFRMKNTVELKKYINKEIIDVIDQYVLFLQRINKIKEGKRELIDISLINIFQNNIRAIRNSDYLNWNMEINKDRPRNKMIR